MRRVELLVVLAGCMRIYPDPELPDVTVRWYDDGCTEPSLEAVATLTGVDDPAFREERVVPCTDLEIAFVDVPRQRFQLATSLRRPGGDPFGTNQEDLDLRDGLDEDTYAFFGSFDNERLYRGRPRVIAGACGSP